MTRGSWEAGGTRFKAYWGTKPPYTQKKKIPGRKIGPAPPGNLGPDGLWKKMAIAQRKEALEESEIQKMKDAWAELKKMLEYDWGLDPEDRAMFDVVKNMMKEIENKMELKL